jgi:hypothetical protein
MYIGSYPSDRTSGAKPRDEFTGDGSTVNFTLSQEVPGGFESNVLVIVDNVLQQPVESYTIGGDNITLQFSEAPASGAVIYVLHQGTATYQMIPVVGSVTPDKLSENLRNFTVDTFTGNGSTVAYTLTATPASANSILVIVDGIVQTRTTNYSLSGTTLTFASAPDNASAITVIHLGFSTVSRTAVPDGSITTAKIADNAITSAKLGFDVIVAEDIAANAITVSELQNGAVTPAKLSTGGPSWDTSGNLGIGVTPSAWAAGSNAVQNAAGSVWKFGTGNIYLGNNYFWNGTNRIYVNSAEAVEYEQSNGVHRWYTAPSGTAGNAVTLTERMRIDNAGNLGIKNAIPQGTLDVGGIGGGQPGDLLVTTGSTTAEVIVGRLSGTSSDNTNFKVRNRVNEVAVLVNAGNKTLQVGKSISVAGATPTSSGSGITFPTVQDSSSDANTLDDYEEGTFTPSYASSGISAVTYGTGRNGYYTKVGRMVTVIVNIMTDSVSVTNSSASVFLTGLPFTASSATEINSSTGLTITSRFNANPPTGGIIGRTQSQITLYRSVNTTADDPPQSTVSDFRTGAGNVNTLRFTATYFTD